MELSRTAYEAYSTTLGGKQADSDASLPSYDDLSEQLKGAWGAAADAVIAESQGQGAGPLSQHGAGPEGQPPGRGRGQA